MLELNGHRVAAATIEKHIRYDKKTKQPAGTYLCLVTKWEKPDGEVRELRHFEVAEDTLNALISYGYPVVDHTESELNAYREQLEISLSQFSK